MNDSAIGESRDPWLSLSESNERPVVDKNELKFSDNFVPQTGNTTKQMTEQMTEQLNDNSLPDSQQYIRSLGNYL